ncbi:MAG: hypothetical protein MK226_17665 [Saprospiraceae bacterium]|nr:hypothetical protein [Saprospiraceae bacterium]
MRTFKIILAISGLIGIGFVAGFMTQRYAFKERMEKAKDYGRGRGLGKFILEKIEATPEQKEQLAPIMQPYTLRLRESVKSFKKEHTAIRDSMYSDMKPYLTAEQFQTLSELKKKFTRKRRKRKGMRERNHN